MNWLKAKTMIMAIVLGVSVSLTLFLTSDSAQAAYNCQKEYNAYARNSDNKTNKQNLSSCIYETPARNYCNNASHRQADGQNPFEDCRAAYMAGFFGRPNTFHADKNIETYNFAKKSKADYQSVYTEQKSGGDSTTPASGGGGSEDASSPAAGGAAGGGGGSTGDTTPASKWQGKAVGTDKLATSSVVIGKSDAQKAGIITDLTGDSIVTLTLNAVYSIVAIIAVIAIIAAGISIIISDGDAQKVATARKAIVYASAGLVIVAFAFIITGVIQGIATK